MNSRQIDPVPWGDRTRLLPKAMTYALSLDVAAMSDGPYLKIPSAQGHGLRHLFEQAVINVPHATRCDVPSGSVESGEGEIGDPSDPSSCWLRMQLRTKLADTQATIYFSCTGVVNFDGGPAAFRSRKQTDLSGSAFLTSSHQVSSATYRWLERRQLFGVGRVVATRGEPKWAERGRWELRFTFDLYAAG